MASKAQATSPGFEGFGPDALLAVQRRYLEAWTGVGQIMVDATQTVLRRQAEMMEAGIKEFWSGREAMLGSGSGEYQLRDQLERMRDYYERAFADFQELGDVMLKAQSEAMHLLGSCATAGLDDIKKAA